MSRSPGESACASLYAWNAVCQSPNALGTQALLIGLPRLTRSRVRLKLGAGTGVCATKGGGSKKDGNCRERANHHDRRTARDSSVGHEGVLYPHRRGREGEANGTGRKMP